VILVDTNILLRSLHLQHPHHDLANNALKLLRLRNETLCAAPQNLVEFWAVATRPLNENGLGMTVARVAGEIAVLRQLFRVLPYTAEVLERWQNIVTMIGDN
jgi:predicted nucleic acid-binding protein